MYKDNVFIIPGDYDLKSVILQVGENDANSKKDIEVIEDFTPIINLKGEGLERRVYPKRKCYHAKTEMLQTSIRGKWRL